METLITKAIPQDTTMGKLTERMIVKEADNLHERKTKRNLSNLGDTLKPLEAFMIASA